MHDFTKGNVTQQIVRFAVPMLIGNLFQQLYSMADAAVVGRFVSGTALAAVGISMAVLNFLLSMLIGLATGASVLIAQFFGAGNERDLKRTVCTSLLFMCGLLVVVTVAGVVGTPFLLRLLNAPEDAFLDCVTYLRITLCGLVATLIYNVYTAYLRALGDSKNPLYFLILSASLNVGLDLLFVAVFRMGVAGAAIATVISQGISAVLCIWYADRKVPLLRVRRFVFDRALLKLVLHYSIPSAIQLSITSLASLTVQRLVNGFGTVAVAGIAAATRIDSFATMPISSVSMAISTFIAQNMGAGQLQRAKKGLHSAMILSLCIGVGISALSFLFGKNIITLFVATTDANAAQIISVGVQYLTVIAASYSLFAIFFSFNGFFRGVGDAVIVMALTITSLTLRAVLAHILVMQFGFGPEAVAYSIPVGWGLCSAFAWFYYKRNLWAGKVRALQRG